MPPRRAHVGVRRVMSAECVSAKGCERAHVDDVDGCCNGCASDLVSAAIDLGRYDIEAKIGYQLWDCQFFSTEYCIKTELKFKNNSISVFSDILHR